ncbi:hypothetical protein [Rhodopseudomonas palustris]|uniref:hypothetical protein n=1 Tax=Rhodopseudomonas palustris TaxID=1076 RepID=UPI000CEBFB3B|nr:hypothetical protein [Rhodopseudomonas palustris]PPQ42127.1 hypothetical protein CKO39_18225 [Rhodopseudomonas palustris]
MDAAIQTLDLIARAALLIVAAALMIAVVQRCWPRALGRKAADPAFDPEACPYGERPGFSARELHQFRPRLGGRADRGGM